MVLGSFFFYLHLKLLLHSYSVNSLHKLNHCDSNRIRLLSSRDLWRLLLLITTGGYYYRVSQYKQFLLVQKLACWLCSANETYLYIFSVSAYRDIHCLLEKYERLCFTLTGIKIVRSNISACRTDNLRGMFLTWLHVYMVKQEVSIDDNWQLLNFCKYKIAYCISSTFEVAAPFRHTKLRVN